MRTEPTISLVTQRPILTTPGELGRALSPAYDAHSLYHLVSFSGKEQCPSTGEWREHYEHVLCVVPLPGAFVEPKFAVSEALYARICHLVPPMTDATVKELAPLLLRETKLLLLSEDEQAAP